MWSDCAQEEIRRQARFGAHVKHEDKENFALASKGDKAKGKKSARGAKSNSKGRKEKDLSKIRCFLYHQFGHYASKCPQRKKGSLAVIAVLQALVAGCFF